MTNKPPAPDVGTKWAGCRPGAELPRPSIRVYPGYRVQIFGTGANGPDKKRPTLQLLLIHTIVYHLFGQGPSNSSNCPQRQRRPDGQTAKRPPPQGNTWLAPARPGPPISHTQSGHPCSFATNQNNIARPVTTHLPPSSSNEGVRAESTHTSDVNLSQKVQSRP